ncbi:MAG: hypothetical protein QOC55_1912, partial [Thermoleophilaceae bacterium]|nr:hypothetical protein [Thermoleophilaceae bacterium]
MTPVMSIDPQVRVSTDGPSKHELSR